MIGLGLASQGNRGKGRRRDRPESRIGEVAQLAPVSVEGEVRLDMPPELTSPAGGLGGPAPPVKEWVTRRGSPNPPGSGTTTRSAAEEEEAMWGGSQYVVGRAQHCGRWTRLASAVCWYR